MENSPLISGPGEPQTVNKTVRRPSTGKSTRRKVRKADLVHKKFSLQVVYGKHRFSLVLVQYQVSNMSMSSHAYDAPPTDRAVLSLLKQNSEHKSGIARAMKKWREVRRTRLPDVIAEKKLQLIYAPREKITEHLEAVNAASKLALAEDKLLNSKENQAMFTEIRKAMWASQTLASKSNGWSGAFDPDDVIQTLKESLRGIIKMHGRDPKGERNPRYKELAVYIWQWWATVQPILSNSGSWGVTQKIAKDSCQNKTVESGALDADP